MTEGVPIWGPITLNVRETLELLQDGATEAAPLLAAGIAIANFDEVVDILDDMLANVGATLTATSQEQFCDALRSWGDDIARLATLLVSPVAAGAAEVVEIFLIEVLRLAAPRLAAGRCRRTWPRRIPPGIA